MARFYGTLQGQRGQASRLGSAASGLRVTGAGWNIGGAIEMGARGEKDTAVMALTGGSNGSRNLGVEVAAFEEEDGRVRYVVRLGHNTELRGYAGDGTAQVWQYRNLDWEQTGTVGGGVL